MILTKEERRKKRHLSIRKKIRGTSESPRVVVFKSNKHIYASLVVDESDSARVLLTVSSLSEEVKKDTSVKIKGYNIEGAKTVGALLGSKSKEMGIEKVVFDRNGYIYAGRVKALAEAARKGGLKF
ncbi:MAG TPA: 50S ribosomal protein L18 [bacterium]|nr:50S ribosomal protein L18 [bacterium]